MSGHSKSSEIKHKKSKAGRPPTDDDATGELLPEDETQQAKAGTKIGKLPREKVMGDFRKIAKGDPTTGD